MKYYKQTPKSGMVIYSMITDKKKVALVGTGMVGMSYAYALLNRGVCDELILIDINRERAKGEAMDLQHGLAFAPTSMKIYAGEYSDCSDADIVVICAGVAQKNGESRLDLLQRNADVFRTIVEPVIKSGFNGIFLIATNPVDIMTRIVYELSGFPSFKIIGSGTTLDTARLRYLIGNYYHLDAKNVHAYVIGEHGDSEFVPWSQAMLATKPIFEICKKRGETEIRKMNEISEEVRTSAQIIISAKKATYYGIGMALVRITNAIFGDENSVLTVSAFLNGEYNEKNIFAGVPSIVNRSGVRTILELGLSENEYKKFHNSCETLRQSYNELKLTCYSRTD